MRYIAAEDIARAKEMDLLTYLRNYEPQELVHVSGNTYCTREHDSLRISNGKWCWFSRGIGGRSALDYLIKVKGIPFTQAAEIILGREAEKPPVFYRQKERKHTNLLMPELSETTDRVEKYLQGRGIHPVIIRYCLDNKLLFESADYHNAMFVGYDKDGKARYGALRSTVSSYKGELTGSDKHFSFFLEGKPNAEHIHVFESAIDLLSFATLTLLAGRDWKSETYLSLAGVFQTKRENVVPVALSRFLDEHPSVRKIHLHLDNDAVGRGAVKGIVGGLQGKYQVYTIKTDDVIEYLRQREICPEKYKASEGWYAGTAGAKKAIAPSCWITLTPEQTKQFELFFEAEMKEMADLITIEELAVFAGYKSTSVVNWCSSKKMKAFKIGGKYFIPKECAIKYLASAAMCRNPQQSYRYKLFVTEFRKQ